MNHIAQSLNFIAQAVGGVPFFVLPGLLPRIDQFFNFRRQFLGFIDLIQVQPENPVEVQDGGVFLVITDIAFEQFLHSGQRTRHI